MAVPATIFEYAENDCVGSDGYGLRQDASAGRGW